MMYRSGNVLFLILLAVALFAALSYAVTQSNRSGGNNISSEKAELGASEILQYQAAVRSAVLRMQMINGVTDQELDFYSTERQAVNGSVLDRDNTLCTETTCQVFHPDGGAISYRDFLEYASDITGSATSMAPGFHHAAIYEITDVGTELPEIVLVVGKINLEVCAAINRRLGIPENQGGDRTGNDFYIQEGDPSVGLASSNAYTYGDDVGEEPLIGKESFCLVNTAGTLGNFFGVVKVR